GSYAGLDFNSGAPLVLSNSAMSANEGVSTICDATGSLLFYTNGLQVYNKIHSQMPNGSGLFGGASSTQSALIVPVPGSTTLYYIFTVPEASGSNGFCYSQVDMMLNGGNGDVINKNTVVNNSITVTEKLAGTMHANGLDVWVCIHENLTDAYYAYLVTATGINAPVITNIGSLGGSVGYMKFSPDGNKLAITMHNDFMDLLDFDNTTGIFSNAATFTAPAGFNSYGVEFSPGSTKLYLSGEVGAGSNLYQFDLNAGSNAAAIATADSVFAYTTWGHAIQLAPDGKIYINHYQTNLMSVINFPELPGIACNAVANFLNLGSGGCSIGLPNFISSYLALSTGINENNDAGNQITIAPNPFSETAAFMIPAEFLKHNCSLNVFEVTGRKVFHSEIVNPEFRFSRRELGNGIYFYQVSSKEKIVGSGKMLIE
ncbi:MAG TPA: hypothetical protein VJY62_07670, partial [Bacteroidia bacterium]|nr:hypothetical protein [Bacteroidia bacterium]